MCWFCGKPKTAVDLLLDEQAYWRAKYDKAEYSTDKAEPERQLRRINEIIIDAAKIEVNKDLEKRLKSIEDAISDLYLTGKPDDDKR
jgi:hypothetical protein